MPAEVDGYEDEHRIFLQGLMCKGVLNSKEVNALHEKALTMCKIDIPEKKAERQGLLMRNIQIINDQLEPVGLIIRKGVDEDTGGSCFMLVNTQNRMVGGSRDLGAHVQVQWSAQELEYLRLMATEILQSDKKSITSREALRLTDQVGLGGGKKLTMEHAEGTINRLIAARWIKLVEENSEIVLDVRFLGEMESWMIEVVGGVAKCQTCRKVVVRGQYCGCEEGVAWHKYCLEKQAKMGATTKCKKCGDVIFAPEEGNKRAAEEERGEPSKGGRGKRVSEEDMEEDEQPSQMERARNRSGGEEVVPKGRRVRSRRKSGDESD
eukprot:GFUD01027446.1.p1 GENE.GFUD01027446.1~~GFUD01027446.1.p1  ORF type:complete len:322 (+),score=137.70 GFUD01027446.1:63-1028(+)